MVKPLNRGDLLRQEYRQKRYMGSLSKEDIIKRAEDIILNMTTLDPSGKVALHGINQTGHYWMEKWTHLLEEYVIRYGPYPNGFIDGSLKAAPMVNPTYPELPKSKSAIDSIGGIQDGSLYKFGKFEHLDKMFKKGIIRIAPASYYSDPSLNKAIQDDELSFTVRKRATDFVIKDKLGNKIPAFGDVKFQLTAPTNYFVHCFSSGYTFREYDDFEADTCIVINKPRKLFQKMMKAVKKTKPHFKGFSSPVKYLDPLTCSPDSINIFFAKHFSYGYQNEVRTIWLPDESINKLEPFFIDIGGMEQYAEIIQL
jgi:hypothetical protein